MAVDSTGICWVAESASGMIGRYDPQTGTYTRIALPGENSFPQPIAVDPQDRVWVGDGHGRVNSRLVEYEPKSGTFTVYPIPKTYDLNNYSLQMIRFQKDGSVWGDMYNGRSIIRLDPATKKVTEFPGVPTIQYGMAIDGDGAVWISEQMAGKMARLDSKSGQLTEFDLPTKDSMPQRLGSDAQGNLWVPEYRAGKIAMIDYRTTKITEYPTPTKNSGPYSISVDRTHNLIWIDEMMAAQLARFDPRTKTFVEYPLPTRLSSVRRIEVDPTRPNRIWFSGLLRDNLGYMDIIE